ncbi:nuclear transport factor 2 family protein [Chryseobacterium arthrosphaerae]|uniref:nuclear transport factor 2 family protein n=1 Tax=Chryseobacterium arthrosphaerae TaxID=651561 RepID=UPI001E2B2F0F|nr:nuclear transport factor 2 family protein [Chryseobacterium arthrosphaerae]UEQ76916.1 nuclear transport factor 2 family protein [Chryseobacterium arthrosphaerae]
MEKIKQAIETFIKGGDNSDAELLEHILHPNYQNIQDGFFDQTGIFVISKEEYISLVRDKIFGGKPREIIYQSIEKKNNIAYAQVSLESSVLRFSSLITCVQNHGRWQIITNIPSIENK